MKDRVKELIDNLHLEPHPEGGYFSETYRSTDTFETSGKDFPAGRNISTSIYYLLQSKDTSLFHRIKSDEIWHHYEGAPLTIHVIDENGAYKQRQLGKEIREGQQPQLSISAGVWFGVTVNHSDSYVLCGCTVSPGFDFKDFEMADRRSMLKNYHHHKKIIEKLTKSANDSYIVSD